MRLPLDRLLLGLLDSLNLGELDELHARQADAKLVLVVVLHHARGRLLLGVDCAWVGGRHM
eukprot:3296520-Prymnesium_polylepis.1